MPAPWGLILRVFAFVCFAILVILYIAKTDALTLEQLLLPLGLAFWVLATIVGPHAHTS